MKVKSIKLKNFLSYEELEINDLDKYSFIVLAGENGSGKSAIIESIVFNLYGKSFRGNIGDLIQKGKEKLSTEIEYVFKKGTVRILREYSASKKDEDGFFVPWGTFSSLKIYINGQDVTHKKIKSTQEKLIGQFFPYSFDFFCKSHFFRKGILKDEGENLPISDLIEELFEVKKIDSISNRCIGDKRNIAKSFVEMSKILGMKHSRLQQLKNLKNKEKSIIENGIASRKDLILERVKEGRSLQAENTLLEEKIISLTKIEEENLLLINDIEKQKKEIENSLYHDEQVLSKKERLFKEQLCSMCERPFTVEDNTRFEKELKELKERIQVFKNTLVKIELSSSALNKEIKENKKELNEKKEKREHNRIEIKFIKEAAKKLQEEIQGFEKENREESVVDLNELKNLEKEILNSFNVLTQSSYVYSLYDKITDELKEGSPFRYYFIRLPELNELISFYCDYFNLNYNVKLEFNKKGKIDIKIYSKIKEEVFKFANLSQGQTRRVILVLLFSVISYLTNNSRHLGLLFFDEILENLDAKGADSVLEYMKYLKQQGLQVFFISHSHLQSITTSEISDKTFWIELDELKGLSRIKEEK